MDDRWPLCMACADLAHLVFLPRGDTALTRRARKHSRLSAVVVRFSRGRQRYERQGVLVEVDAIELAETECLADADARARRREREAERRAGEDDEFQRALAREIAALFPGCPPARCEEIARHTGERAAAAGSVELQARALDPDLDHARGGRGRASRRHRVRRSADGRGRTERRTRPCARRCRAHAFELGASPSSAQLRDADGELLARVDPELAVDRGEVVLDRLGADEDRRSGLARGHPVREQPCDLQLLRREVVERRVVAPPRGLPGRRQLDAGLFGPWLRAEPGTRRGLAQRSRERSAFGSAPALPKGSVLRAARRRPVAAGRTVRLAPKDWDALASTTVERSLRAR